MSPRAADPSVRTALVETAARLLTDEGPAALTTRRLARELGTSTMAVYTHFDGMDELLGAISVEGFRRLGARLGRVPTTDDPVADLAGLGRAYHQNARRNPALYQVMFGSGARAELTLEDEAMSRATFETLVQTTDRCIRAGRFRSVDPWPAAQQLWALAHGVVMLEMAGFLGPAKVVVTSLADSMCTLAVGMGDDPALARRSVESTRSKSRR